MRWRMSVSQLRCAWWEHGGREACVQQCRTPENPTVETDSVAEGAVLPNRSLAQNSLLAGNLQGIFADFGSRERF
jgi:hypothetical protein